ncbi:MAG TPA: hypothetical protein PKM71_06225, partial [Candidatus Cloacimonas sp.]|nr:hypothetical protein [Candidatus Cloacimonas sp.]
QPSFFFITLFAVTEKKVVDREVNITGILVDEDVNPPKRRNDILSFPLQPSFFYITLFTVTKKKVVDRDINPPVSLSASQHHRAAHFKN